MLPVSAHLPLSSAALVDLAFSVPLWALPVSTRPHVCAWTPVPPSAQGSVSGPQGPSESVSSLGQRDWTPGSLLLMAKFSQVT